MINTKIFIENIQAEGEKVLTSANNFLNLSQAQLSWKPAPSKWSASLCFLHLININNYFLEFYKQHFKENINANEKTFFPFKNSLMGKLIRNSVKPETKLKTKTTKNFDPKDSEVPKDIVEKFIDQHKTLMQLSEKFKNADIKNINITSPLNKFIKYNLGDSLEIIIFHDQRHILQAKNIVKTNDFPVN